MKKLKTALISIMQVLVIAAILFIIFFGLNRLGLISLPKPLAALFDGHDDAITAPSADPSDDEARAGTVYETIELSKDAVRAMLDAVTPPPCYTLSVNTTLYAGDGSRTEQIVIRHDNGCDAAYLYDGDHVKKQVLCDGNKVYVNAAEDDPPKSVQYEIGDITFEQQLGTVYTHTSFLEKVSDDKYSFELITEDEDVYLLISFDDVLGSYVQHQQYKLDPDSGIVVEAAGFEGETAVFTSVVTSYDEELTEPAAIPEPYLTLENELFTAKQQA